MKYKFFLDSGAFTIYNSIIKKGKDTSYTKTKEFKNYLDNYIKFLLRYKDYFDVYANIDIIGDAEKTWEIQKYIESFGLKPLPVFHVGEDLKYFKRYIDSYDYIAIGGLVNNTSTGSRFFYLDKLFNIICNTPNRFPRVKVHGFGMTSVQLIFRYPWYSIDSMTSLKHAGYGVIYIPKKIKGKYVYNNAPYCINISSRSSIKGTLGKHFNTFSKNKKKVIVDYLLQYNIRLGESIFKKVEKNYELKENEIEFKRVENQKVIEIIKNPGVCNQWREREKVNMIYFLKVSESLPPWPWSFKKENTIWSL